MATSPPQHSANAQDTPRDHRAKDSDPSTTPAQESESSPEQPVELHSGHKLAKRYRLEECITRLDGFSSWRAVDEKLRRAVGIHVLPAAHERAPAVLSAARSAALLGEPRFVQVLDAVEEHEQVHIIHEWVPDAVPVSTLLHSGPLDAHEAATLATQVSQALAAAHRAGLSHLRLTPATVLRTGPSQYRIRGLAVDAALRGITASDAKRADTQAIGALLYAALTQRWPYPEGAYGLDGVVHGRGPRDAMVAPDQVRAGVHRGLSDLAMRALINNGATAASHTQPCTSPEELVEELARLPRIPPADPTPTQLPRYQRAAYQPTSQAPVRPPVRSQSPETQPTLPGRMGTVLKWGVSALLITALGLGSWQLADALMQGDTPSEPAAPSAPPAKRKQPAAPQPLTIQQATDFDPYDVDDGTENPELVPAAIDGDPATEWYTRNYFGPDLGNLKPGVGLVLDLGEPQSVSSITVEAVGETTVEFRAAPDATVMPSSRDDYIVVDSGTGESLTLEAEDPVTTQFVLVWLTDLPIGDDGNYRGRISEVTVSG